MGRVGHIWPVFNKKISTSKGAPVATSPIPSEKELQDAAYARAQDAIATARASGASHLTLSGDNFSDLAVLPPDIGSLTALTDLFLSDTPVSDLSPLLSLTQLAADYHGSAGLAFQNTAAALADPRIPGSPKSPVLRTIPSAPPVCLPI